MPQSEEEPLVALAARLEHDGPRFARAPRTGRPARPREYRRTWARWTLAAGLAGLTGGVLLSHGLLIAAGLVVTGIGVQLLDAHRARGGRRHLPLR